MVIAMKVRGRLRSVRVFVHGMGYVKRFTMVYKTHRRKCLTNRLAGVLKMIRWIK